MRLAPRRPLPRTLLSEAYFAAILLILALATAGSFLFKGAFGWACGTIYIFYDTALLAYTVFKIWPILRAAAPKPPRVPARRMGLAVIVPARNEALVLPACLEALLSQEDPPDEIIFVDDGSTDGTAPLLQSRFGVSFAGQEGRSALHPSLRVWRKTNSGKARSLNEAWPRAESEIVVTIDADTILQPGAVVAMRRAFESEPGLAAACGIITPHCRPGFGSACFEIFQRFEYIRTNLGRLAWMRSDSLLMVPGAFAAYRRDVLQKVGGFTPDSLVEDYDVIHKIFRWSHEHGRPVAVRVIPDARAATDAPNNARAFLKQRQRLFAGFLETQFEHRDMVGNPRYGAVGTFMLPIKSADTLEPVYGLMAYALAAKMVLTGGRMTALAWWILSPGLALNFLTLLGFILLYQKWQGTKLTARECLLAFAATILEPFGFRLLRHAAALTGWIGFLEGTSDWAPQRPSRLQALRGRLASAETAYRPLAAAPVLQEDRR